MSRSFSSARIRTRSGWANPAAAVDRSRSARVAFRPLPIGFVRSLDSIRVKEHSDLKRGVHISPVPIGVLRRAYKGFRPSPDQADGLCHPHMARGKGVSMKLSEIDARIPSASVTK